MTEVLRSPIHSDIQSKNHVYTHNQSINTKRDIYQI